ncbi:hypothetical protein, partial [Mariniluteicoccus flavus]
MPGPYPREFREDVVAVARRRESGVTIKQAHPNRGWVAGVARRSRGRRRGLHMMGVLTLPIWKTSTWPTLP